MKRRSVHFAVSFFAILCIVFIPFPFNLFDLQLGITESIFGNLIAFISKGIFGLPIKDTHVYSDTRAMYVLLLILFILSILVTLILSRLKNWDKYKERILQFIYMFICYYLALQLLKYGLDKVFKNQFYVPEPNTLYTPMGKVPRDLLYWSSMGTSHFYNVFLGAIEIIAALFLLIKRTRLIGLLLSFFIMMNVIAINFGFDISVKAFSLLLLLFTIYLLIPYFNNLYQFFLAKRTGEIIQPVGKTVLVRNRFLAGFLKCFAVGIILLEAFYPFFRSGNFNGDISKRPYMHGAYEVKQFVAGTDTLLPNNFPVRRFFIHKDNYMIFQGVNDEMVDYKLLHDAGKQQYALVDYNMKKEPIWLEYNAADSTLQVSFKLDQLTGKALDWRKLPALKKEFHWAVDEQ